MSFNKLITLFTQPTQETAQDPYEYKDTWNKEDHDIACTPTYIPTLLDMSKMELQEFAKNMYGLECKGMHASNILKAMYENVHGKEQDKRGRKKVAQ